MRLTVPLTLAIALVTFTTTSFAADFPERMVSLLKANDHIGVASNTQTGECNVIILTPKEYELANDFATLELSRVAEKHPDVAKQISQLRTQGETERAKSLATGTELGRTEVSIAAHVGELGKVIHVGQDYLLIEFPSAKARRVAIASSKIARVSWGLTTTANVSHQAIK